MHGSTGFGPDHPERTLLIEKGTIGGHAQITQCSQQRWDEIPMTAGHAVDGVQREQQCERGVEVCSLGERLGGFDLEPQAVGEWLEGLHAAHIGAGDETTRAEALEEIGESIGLRIASIGEGPQTVVALPL